MWVLPSSRCLGAHFVEHCGSGVARGRPMSPRASPRPLRCALGSFVVVPLLLSCNLCAFCSLFLSTGRGSISLPSPVCSISFELGSSQVQQVPLGPCAMESISPCCAVSTSLLICARYLLGSSRLQLCGMRVFSVGCCVVGFSRWSLSGVACKVQ